MYGTSVGIRELKNRFSQYMRRVKAGETVIITERGKPVGQIVPMQNEPAGRLKKLAEAGIVEWDGKPIPPYRPKATNRGEGLLSDLVSEDRE
jgi:prevent-host-death family protein